MANTANSKRTHPIGKGTVNLSVNMPVKLYNALKKIAEAEGKSLGKVSREILQKGAGVYFS